MTALKALEADRAAVTAEVHMLPMRGTMTPGPEQDAVFAVWL